MLQITFEHFTEEFKAFVGIDLFTMIFAWINLLILYLAFKKFLFGPIKKMIDDRQAEIDGMYSDAEGSKKDAEEMKAEYEKRLEGATEESEKILKDAQRRAELRGEEIIRDANSQAARILERAEEEIELEKKRAINEVKNEVSEMAIGIASAVIERDVSESEHRALIDDFIRGMGE
mgnify:CR=1 FL=1